MNYRHIPENNLEQYKVLMVLNLKIGDRKAIRVLIHENDNIKELGSRLITYLY